MSVGTVLHIRARGESTARVLELSGASVRIGRGPRCEVRLDESALAEVQCLLRRRGHSWHVQPVGPPGRLSIEGRAVEHARSLPLGVPLRVGDTWLTISPAEPLLDQHWGEHAPPTAAPFAAPADSQPIEESRAGIHGDFHQERPRDQSTIGAVRGTLDQRERRLRERLEQLRRPSFLRQKIAEKPIVPPTAAVEPRPPLDPPHTTPPLEPQNDSHSLEITNDEEIASKVSLNFADESTAPDLVQTAIECQEHVSVDPVAITAEARLGDSNEVRALDHNHASGSFPVPAAIPESLDLSARTSQKIIQEYHYETTDSPAWNAPSPLKPSVEAPRIEIEWTVPKPPFSKKPSAEPSPELDAPTGRGFVILNRTAPTSKPSSKPIPRPKSTLPSPRPRERLTDEAPPPPFSAQSARIPDRESSIVEPPQHESWPSAVAILEAHRARTTRSADSVRQSGASVASSVADEMDVLTIPQPPPGWSLKKGSFLAAWLVLFSTAATSGVGLTALSWTWAIDDESAGRAFDKLSATGSKLLPADAAELVETSPNRTDWWKTTADHLFYRAILVDRAGNSLAGDESPAELLAKARAASPANPGVRLAFASLAASRANNPGAPAPIETLGLSRDIVSLGFTAKGLLKSGRREAAWNVARHAIELALGADPSRLAPPTFLEDRRFRRFTLPREELLAPIFRDLAAIEPLDLDRLAADLPESALVRLVLARVALEKDDGRLADKAIELALAAAEPNDPDPRARSEHFAARAEALALRENWSDAVESYRRAIAAINDDPTRRAWSLNLADLLGRLGDDPARATALAEAKSTDPKDEITRRAAEAQRAAAGDTRDPNLLRTRADPP